MPNQANTQALRDMIEALRRDLVTSMGEQLVKDPQQGEVLNRVLDEWLESLLQSQPSSNGAAFTNLIGIGPNPIPNLGAADVPLRVDRYDDEVAIQRIDAVADLYYIYQHEKIGVFRAVQKLQELFRSGAIRLSDGAGAQTLYTYDRKHVLRYTQRDRLAAYRRVFGYGNAPMPPSARANTEFHGLFTQFMNQVAIFWRDKRISDVIRERADDPSFGSIAIVRRAGLDLRHNLRFMSYGHIMALRAEVMQLLQEAFQIFDSSDVLNQMGASSGWDVIEEILSRYYGEQIITSPRQRMAETGRTVLFWLAQSHLLQPDRIIFEQLLKPIAEPAEEWLTSAKSVGVSSGSAMRTVQPYVRRPVVMPSRPPSGGFAGPRRAPATTAAANEAESVYEYQSDI